MRKIKIRNFGPIREGYIDDDGFFEIKKVTFFIGDQGTGKSSVAKLISILLWIEKAVHRGEIDASKFTYNAFINLLTTQRLNNYWRKKETFFDYYGLGYRIFYNGENVRIQKNTNAYEFQVPKIMYVPAERSFLSSVKNAFDVKGLPDPLFWFAEEFKKSQIKLKGKSVNLPIGTASYNYDIEVDHSFVRQNGGKINLLEASSGYQSLVPLFIVTNGLMAEINSYKNSQKLDNVNENIRMNVEANKLFWESEDSIPVGQVKESIRVANRKYISTCLANIVEEPELNLFPDSQRELLYSLLSFNNEIEQNLLVVTTHSPYLINYLTHAIKAYTVLQKVLGVNKKNLLYERLSKLISITSMVRPSDWVVYELNSGQIKALPDYKGLPTDENFLNSAMANSNKIFAQLLEIEDLC